jgi:hypothetical protein
MYLRQSKQKRADGREITYLQLAENVWDATKGRSQAQIVFNCGRADDPEVIERLRRLAKSILRRCSPEAIVADDPGWRLVCAWPYGDVHALQAVWQRLGIDVIVRAQAHGRRFGFEMERALFALVANRACAPASKLYCHEQWLKEECTSKARKPWRCISSTARWTFSRRTRRRSSRRSSSRSPTC